jgi:hypothetical protein
MTSIELKSPLPALTKSARKARPYVGVMLFLLFAGVYGYMILKINKLADPQIDQTAVNSDVKTLPIPRIDSNAAKQLLTLKDNSVNVQTLFEQSRKNPFLE